MQPIIPVPTFDTHEAASEAARRGHLAELRTTYATETDGWGTTTFVVVADTVEFSLVAPASDGREYAVKGWFPVNGDATEGEIEEARTFDDDDLGEMENVMTSAGGELLSDVAEVWLGLDEDTRHQLTQSDVLPWLEAVAADAWLAEQAPAQDPLVVSHLQERVWRAQSRATAYAMTGPAGRVARRLVADDWAGDAIRLVATAEAQAASGTHPA